MKSCISHAVNFISSVTYLTWRNWNEGRTLAFFPFGVNECKFWFIQNCGCRMWIFSQESVFISVGRRWHYSSYFIQNFSNFKQVVHVLMKFDFWIQGRAFFSLIYIGNWIEVYFSDEKFIHSYHNNDWIQYRQLNWNFSLEW